MEERLTTVSGGLRVLSNFVQIMQLLHQYQHRKKLSAEELLAWLQKSTEGLENEGDDYELQIESDDDAVKIVTIHKSKGLEYNIVFCENLSFNNNTPSRNFEFTSFKHQDDHLFFDTSQLPEPWMEDWALQNTQENRRLMYVAVTRAAYKCYIGYSVGRSGKLDANSSLEPFINAIDHAPSHLIAPYTKRALPAPAYALQTSATINFLDYDPGTISLSGSNWRKMSFSALTAKGQHQTLPESTTDVDQDAYADFVFNTLQRGSYTGNLLHHLLEQLDFNDERNHQLVIERSLNRFAQYHKEYATYLPEMIRNILGAQLQSEIQQFTLSAIPNHARISELEFNFMVPPLKVEEILSATEQYMPLQFSLPGKTSLEGFMNGFIDLFFEYEGQYYILDWKSNYLGNKLEYYEGENLEAAMTQQHYHLQYLIYTIAANKFLSSRLGSAFDYEKHFGGVFYLFLRGLRSGSPSGIFYTKPPGTMIHRLDHYFQAGKV